MLTNMAISGLLGTLVLAAGLPASASDTPAESSDQQNAEQASPEQSGSDETVRITVSLPNGRKYVIEQSAQTARAGSPLGSRVTRVLPDGSRMSYGTAAGSSKSSARVRSTSSARKSAGGSSGSGGKVSRLGSGVSGGSAGGKVSFGGSSGSGGGGGGGKASGGGGGGGSAAAAAPRAARVAFVGGDTETPRSTPALGSSGSSTSGSSPSSSNSGSSNTAAPPQSVPTIGSPRYSDDGATGGQDVRFHDAGMSALVVGRTVFIWGAEIVQSTADFNVIQGERFAFDGAVVRERQEKTPSSGTLTSVDQMFAPLKLEYAPGTTTTLTMFSRADNPDLPSREMRTWTFRVR